MKKIYTHCFLILSILISACNHVFSQWIEYGGVSWKTTNCCRPPVYDLISTISVDKKGNVYVGWNRDHEYFYLPYTDGINWRYLDYTGSFSWPFYCLGLTCNRFNEVFVHHLSYNSPHGFQSEELNRYILPTTINNILIKTYNYSYSIGGMATDTTGNLLYGNLDSSNQWHVEKWNGGNQKLIDSASSNMFSNKIESIAINKENDVFASSWVKDSLGINRPFVAKWKGTRWSKLLGTKQWWFNGLINQIVTDSASNVYAIGNFKNDSSKAFVAKWDGLEWTELGNKNDSSFNKSIYSIASDNKGNLYAAGAFTNDSGYYFVAKWDGTNWSELGGKNKTVFNGIITSIGTDGNGAVYAGGSFTTFFDSTHRFPYNYVAKYIPATTLSVQKTTLILEHINNQSLNLHWSSKLEHALIRKVQLEQSENCLAFTLSSTATIDTSGQIIEKIASPELARTYYRLKLILATGKIVYSNIVGPVNRPSKLSLSVYPNPATNQITINSKDMVSVSVLDAYARKVAEAVATGSKANVDLHHLPPGNYFIKAIDKEGKTIISQFLKK